MTLRHPLASLFLLASAAAIVYANTFQNAFVFDDLDFIVYNRHIVDWADIGSVWHYWPTRFIAMATFALNMQWHGLEVWGFHAVNLIIHIAGAWLVWRLIMLTMATPALRAGDMARHGPVLALLAGLVFAVHPVQTEAVTYIYQRCASLATVFFVASLVLYVRARLGEEGGLPPVHSLWYYGASLLLALLGAFTKETVITLPLMVALYEWVFFKNSGKVLLRRALPYAAVMLALPVALFSTGIAQHELVQYGRDLPKDVSLVQYVVTEFRVIMTYIGLLFFPVHQNLDYDYPVTRYPLMDAWATASLAAIVWIVSVALRERARRPLMAFGILWFFITLLPESSVLVLNQVIFEHRLYLPMAGFVFFLTGAAYALFTGRRLVLMCAVLWVFIVTCGVLTVRRNVVWRDGISLWSDCIKKSPNRARPYANRGRAYGERGQYDKAIADITQALKLNPDFLPARALLEKYQGLSK